DLILFRGQQDLNWRLIPQIGRKETRLKSKGQSEIGKVEARIFESFKRLSLPFLQTMPESELDWLAIAQHHGLPTRLLDWTSNAMAGLWFVVRKAPEDRKPGVVWVLKPENEDFISGQLRKKPFEAPSTRVFRPQHINRRLVAQAGYFTLH